MTGALIGIMAGFALVIWLIRRTRQEAMPRPPRGGGGDEIDHAELEAAEREVRDLGVGARPDEEFPNSDWGPGAAKPRPPERL